MPTAYLGLGSNLGDRNAQLCGALELLSALPDTTLAAQSPIYETPPMGPQDQGAYLNMAAHLETSLEPAALFAELQRIENRLGRTTPEHRRHWGPRVIDIDLLLYDDCVIETNALTVPHPGLAERWFVLRPLADIAPDAVHPALGQSIASLLAALENTGVPQGTPR